jgi:hypothetical protein
LAVSVGRLPCKTPILLPFVVVLGRFLKATNARMMRHFSLYGTTGAGLAVTAVVWETITFVAGIVHGGFWLCDKGCCV